MAWSSILFSGFDFFLPNFEPPCLGMTLSSSSACNYRRQARIAKCSSLCRWRQLLPLPRIDVKSYRRHYPYYVNQTTKQSINWTMARVANKTVSANGRTPCVQAGRARSSLVQWGVGKQRKRQEEIATRVHDQRPKRWWRWRWHLVPGCFGILYGFVRSLCAPKMHPKGLRRTRNTDTLLSHVE
jgi:hypothetical protein